jgi:hypothetical protein
LRVTGAAWRVTAAGEERAGCEVKKVYTLRGVRGRRNLSIGSHIMRRTPSSPHISKDRAIFYISSGYPGEMHRYGGEKP